MLSNAQNNFENEFIAGAIRLTDGNPSINWGYNSGGYEKYQYFITADSGCLAIDTVINEYHKVNFNDPDDRQWYIVGVQVNYEDNDLYDDHTGEQIKPAYYDDDYQSGHEDFE